MDDKRVKELSTIVAKSLSLKGSIIHTQDSEIVGNVLP